LGKVAASSGAGLWGCMEQGCRGIGVAASRGAGAEIGLGRGFAASVLLALV